MNDVEREAQAVGYECGKNRKHDDRYKQYSNLQAAYRRGWEQGLRDRDMLDKNRRITEVY